MYVPACGGRSSLDGLNAAKPSSGGNHSTSPSMGLGTGGISVGGTRAGSISTSVVLTGGNAAGGYTSATGGAEATTGGGPCTSSDPCGPGSCGTLIDACGTAFDCGPCLSCSTVTCDDVCANLLGGAPICQSTYDLENGWIIPCYQLSGCGETATCWCRVS